MSGGADQDPGERSRRRGGNPSCHQAWHAFHDVLTERVTGALRRHAAARFAVEAPRPDPVPRRRGLAEKGVLPAVCHDPIVARSTGARQLPPVVDGAVFTTVSRRSAGAQTPTAAVADEDFFNKRLPPGACDKHTVVSRRSAVAQAASPARDENSFNGKFLPGACDNHSVVSRRSAGAQTSTAVVADFNKILPPGACDNRTAVRRRSAGAQAAPPASDEDSSNGGLPSGVWDSQAALLGRRRSADAQASPPAGDEDSFNGGLPSGVWDSDAALPSRRSAGVPSSDWPAELQGRVLQNETGYHVRIALGRAAQAVLPPRCGWLCADARDWAPLLAECAGVEGGTAGWPAFRVVLADPPWPSHSASRGRVYRTMPRGSRAASGRDFHRGAAGAGSGPWGGSEGPEALRAAKRPRRGGASPLPGEGSFCPETDAGLLAAKVQGRPAVDNGVPAAKVQGRSADQFPPPPPAGRKPPAEAQPKASEQYCLPGAACALSRHLSESAPASVSSPHWEREASSRGPDPLTFEAIAGLPVPAWAGAGAVAGVWVTNSVKVIEFVLLTCFPRWRLCPVGTLCWVKTRPARPGEPEIPWGHKQRKPYELCLLAAAPPHPGCDAFGQQPPATTTVVPCEDGGFAVPWCCDRATGSSPRTARSEPPGGCRTSVGGVSAGRPLPPGAASGGVQVAPEAPGAMQALGSDVSGSPVLSAPAGDCRASASSGSEPPTHGFGVPGNNHPVPLPVGDCRTSAFSGSGPPTHGLGVPGSPSAPAGDCRSSASSGSEPPTHGFGVPGNHPALLPSTPAGDCRASVFTGSEPPTHGFGVPGNYHVPLLSAPAGDCRASASSGSDAPTHGFGVLGNHPAPLLSAPAGDCRASAVSTSEPPPHTPPIETLSPTESSCLSLIAAHPMFVACLPRRLHSEKPYIGDFLDGLQQHLAGGTGRADGGPGHAGLSKLELFGRTVRSDWLTFGNEALLLNQVESKPAETCTLTG